MLMADMLKIFLIVLGFLLAFPALWLVYHGLFTRTIERARHRCQHNPVKCFLLGGLIAGGMVAGVAGASAAGGVAGQVVAVSVVVGCLLWAHLGLAGLATHLGRALPSNVDGLQPWRATLRGAVALELTYLLPFIGWFGALPLSWIYGAGAASLAALDTLTGQPVASLEDLPC